MNIRKSRNGKYTMAVTSSGLYEIKSNGTLFVSGYDKGSMNECFSRLCGEDCR